MNRPGIFKRYSFAWVMLAWFVGSIVLHLVLALANSHTVAEWAEEVAANHQSEAIQLLFQVVGLRFLLCVGSPSSKEGTERLEAKIDAILSSTVRDGDDTIQRIDTEFMRDS
jgi:hypothetical protein